MHNRQCYVGSTKGDHGRFELALLSEELGREVDLVFLNDCDPIIGMQVLANGALILNIDPACHLRFFMRTVSEYLDLKRHTIEFNYNWARLEYPQARYERLQPLLWRGADQFRQFPERLAQP